MDTADEVLPSGADELTDPGEPGTVYGPKFGGSTEGGLGTLDSSPSHKQ